MALMDSFSDTESRDSRGGEDVFKASESSLMLIFDDSIDISEV